MHSKRNAYALKTQFFCKNIHFVYIEQNVQNIERSEAY